MSASAEARARALTKRYLSSLPEKRARLQALHSQWIEAGGSEESLRRLKLQVHRLAGSAGSYGLEELGLVAARLDRCLGSPQCREPGNASTRLMQELLAALDRQIRRQR